MEDLIVEEGQVMNPRFSTYRIPTATEMPPIRSLWVETNDPRGPYGAKGLGEMGLVPTAAAIANAVKNATGARITASRSRRSACTRRSTPERREVTDALRRT